MFTGIIEGMGVIRSTGTVGEGMRIAVEAEFDLEGVRIGDSIAVNGACLTAVRLEGRRFYADVSPETVRRTALGKARIGERVNIERALRLSDRLDGHLVSGHIDGMGRIRDRKNLSNAVIIAIDADSGLTRYMIEKGSVAVDGVSLTINRLTPEGFEVSIIPHTARLTTVGIKQPGAAVNIETDLIGKYVERFMVRPAGMNEDKASPPASLTLGLLAENGFI